MPTETTARARATRVAHVGGGHPAAATGVPLTHRPDRAREAVGVDQLGGVDRPGSRSAGRARPPAPARRAGPPTPPGASRAAPRPRAPCRRPPRQAIAVRAARSVLRRVDRPQSQHDDGEGRREHTLHGDPLGGRPERHGEPGGHGQCRGARRGAARRRRAGRAARPSSPRRPPRGAARRSPSGPASRRTRFRGAWVRRPGRAPRRRRTAAPRPTTRAGTTSGARRERRVRDGIPARRPPARSPARLTVASASRSSRRRVESSSSAGASASRDDRAAATGRRGCGAARSGRRRGAVDAHDVAVQPVGGGAHDGSTAPAGRSSPSRSCGP